MRPTVRCDFMAGVVDTPDEIRVLPDQTAKHEERRSRLALFENLEQ